MMEKEFKALDNLEECAEGMKDLPKSNWIDLAEDDAELDLNIMDWVDTVRDALTELKAIKESHPSKALKQVTYLSAILPDWQRVNNGVDSLSIIKQALLKAQELEKEIEILKEYRKDYLSRLENLEKYSLKQDKALEIIKEKKIDVVNLCCSLDAESYNLSVDNQRLNDTFKITQEEFNLLEEIL